MGPIPGKGGWGQPHQLGQDPVLRLLVLILQVFAFRLTEASFPMWTCPFRVCVCVWYMGCMGCLCVHAAQPQVLRLQGEASVSPQGGPEPQQGLPAAV